MHDEAVAHHRPDAQNGLAMGLDQVRFDEMRHRYSNAVQLAASMLALEARTCTHVPAKQVLNAAAERLGVLRQLYMLLDETVADEPVSARKFLDAFCGYLRGAYFTSGNVTCTADCDETELAAATCRLLGRAVHELVVNALKHAFASRANGQITITSRRVAAGMWRCSVEDDGAGFSASASNQGGLGRTLVTELARQMGGYAAWEPRERGAAVHLLIPVEQALPAWSAEAGSAAAG